ncbi:MAG TPA: alpha-glucosidase [Anaerolineales bacterium]|nr:alpha-glucosidase [Anaerolineales bacterium]
MNKAWWKEAVVYQIYPRSFYDSNGDGVGDLRGILQKLDYLQELGIDVVWLCPVYKSPNDDNGYDISHYQDIMDEFGTLADWDELLAEMHKRGIKLVMDLVVNHTSDEHAWFREARTSKENPYRDFYVWRPAKNGAEPNNWRSFFSGSAWQYDEQTGEYYLHLFTKKQPDLNWENPKVREEVYKMMDWWLQKGIDGFRMDVINLISKVPGLPDAPVVNQDRYQFGGQYFANGPRLMEFLTEMKQKVLSRYDILTVGETPFVTTRDAIMIANEETGALKMVFQFEHMDLSAETGAGPDGMLKPWKLLDLKRVMTRWQKDLENRAWNSIYLGNHDQPRSVSQFGDDGQYRVESAKMLATFVHMLQGTPYVYQGDEVGMTNVAFESIEDYRDVATRNMYREAVQEKGADPGEMLKIVHVKSRDNARTPMQWDARDQAGFTTGMPWIKVNPNYKEINVVNALTDPNSIFYYYKKLIQLRKDNPVVVYGAYDLMLDSHEEIYAFTRTLEQDRLLIILNFSRTSPVFHLPETISCSSAELLISNYNVDVDENIRQITLRPFEARVYRLS